MDPISMGPNGEWSIEQDRMWGKIILESFDGVLIEKSLKFNFNANNNQAKYEALLTGMM